MESLLPSCTFFKVVSTFAKNKTKEQKQKQANKQKTGLRVTVSWATRGKNQVGGDIQLWEPRDRIAGSGHMDHSEAGCAGTHTKSQLLGGGWAGRVNIPCKSH